MKMKSYLSALIVGLSLAVASTQVMANDPPAPPANSSGPTAATRTDTCSGNNCVMTIYYWRRDGQGRWTVYDIQTVPYSKDVRDPREEF